MKSNLAVNLDDHWHMPDVQSLQDNRQIAIQKVGVKDSRVPMNFIEIDDQRQHTIGQFDLYVSLAHNRRGVQMSRLVEIINGFANVISLENIHEILVETKSRLLAQQANLSIKFPYFLYKEAPVSGLASPVEYKVKISGTINDRNFTDLFLEVKVPVTTVCPCSKGNSDKGAHYQRSRVTVKIKVGVYFSLKDVIRAVEASASCEIYGLLKREDEKYVTERGYDNPRFVEDMVREVALRLQKSGNFSWFSVESENFESIHDHSAYAYIETKNCTKTLF